MEAVCSNEERPWISIDIGSVLNEALLPLVAECKSESGWDPVRPSCIVGGDSPSLEEKSISDGASALSHGWVFLQKAWRLLQGDDQSCEVGALKSKSDTGACIGAGAKKPSHFYSMEGATWTRDLEKSLSLSLPIQVCKESKSSRSSINGKKKSKKPPRPPKPHSKAPAADDSASAARSAMEAMKVSIMQKRAEKIARKNRASTAAAAAAAARGSSLDLGTILSLAFTIFVAALILFQGLSSFSSQQKQQAVQLNQPVLQSSKPMNAEEAWTPLILAQHELVVDNDSHLQAAAAAEPKAPTSRSMEARIFLRQK